MLMFSMIYEQGVLSVFKKMESRTEKYIRIHYLKYLVPAL